MNQGAQGLNIARRKEAVGSLHLSSFRGAISTLAWLLRIRAKVVFLRDGWPNCHHHSACAHVGHEVVLVPQLTVQPLQLLLK